MLPQDATPGDCNERLNLLGRRVPLRILREHMFAEDIALARIPDTQGLGGAAEAALQI